MNDIPVAADLLATNILLNHIDNVDGNIIGEIARTTVQKYEIIVRLLRYNNHKCQVSNINALSVFGCPKCNTFSSRRFNLERPLTTCGERVKNVYLRNVYQIRETIFDKVESSSVKYTNQQKLFKI